MLRKSNVQCVIVVDDVEVLEVKEREKKYNKTLFISTGTLVAHLNTMKAELRLTCIGIIV